MRATERTATPWGGCGRRGGLLKTDSAAREGITRGPAPRLSVALLGALTLVLLVAAVSSLRWGAVQDAPIMMYLAYLIDHFDYVPYRDFFDLNLPGTYVLNLLGGRCFGYTDAGIRRSDIVYLSLILAVTWLWLRRFGWRVGWCGAVLFGLVYLGQGPYLSMQREYLTILPISGAVLAFVLFPDRYRALRAFVVGILLAFAATIRLQATIGLPVLVVFQVLDLKDAGSGTRPRHPAALAIVAWSLAGFLVPLAFVGACLRRMGAMSPLWDIARNYWFLHGSLTGAHAMISGGDRIVYLLRDLFALGPYAIWLLPAAFALYVCYARSTLGREAKRNVTMLGLMGLSYWIYPAIAGQFWDYHWLLFGFFAVTLSSLCLVDQGGAARSVDRLFPAGALMVAALLGAVGPEQMTNHFRHARRGATDGRADSIAAYLRTHLRPGDTVQPLDWTWGGVHAMLLAGAEIATSFVYDYHFYHHVSNAYVQGLRISFSRQLERARPRFIVHVEPEVPRVRGVDATTEFPALQHLLDTEYSVAATGPGYLIYEARQTIGTGGAEVGRGDVSDVPDEISYPDSYFKAAFLAHTMRRHVPSGSAVHLKVVVENRGDGCWPKGGLTRLGYDWFDAEGEQLTRLAGRAMPAARVSCVILQLVGPDRRSLLLPDADRS